MELQWTRRSPAGACAGERQAVVVVSPHPDDDILGAGGTMALLAAQGWPVFSVYVTDGAPPGCGLAARREAEAMQALRLIGARAAVFMHFASDALAAEGARALKEHLRAVLGQLQPGVLYVPSPFERHPTHLRITAAVVAALRSPGAACPELWGYSVWGSTLGCPGTKMVDISSVQQLKRRAVAKHRSQLAGKPYHRGMAGKNAYEGIYAHTHDLRSCEQAEVFLDMQELMRSRRMSLKAFARKVMQSCLEHIYG